MLVHLAQPQVRARNLLVRAVRHRQQVLRCLSRATRPHTHGWSGTAPRGQPDVQRRIRIMASLAIVDFSPSRTVDSAGGSCLDLLEQTRSQPPVVVRRSAAWGVSVYTYCGRPGRCGAGRVPRPAHHPWNLKVVANCDRGDLADTTAKGFDDFIDGRFFAILEDIEDVPSGLLHVRVTHFTHFAIFTILLINLKNLIMLILLLSNDMLQGLPTQLCTSPHVLGRNHGRARRFATVLVAALLLSLPRLSRTTAQDSAPNTPARAVQHYLDAILLGGRTRHVAVPG